MVKNNKKSQSVEPEITDLATSWLKSYKLDYKLQQASLNDSIDKALNYYFSKQGGNGGNRPDAKLLLQDKNLQWYPILIEFKGYKECLEKLNDFGQISNKTVKNEIDFKSINEYAVNGAVHYANAILQYTDYTDIISIGMTGWKDERGILNHRIGVYYVSKSNFGVGQKVDDYSDLSFLKKDNFDEFILKVKSLHLSQEETERIKEKREQEISASLVKLNNDIYKNERGLGENDRVYLVAASIIATLGIPGKVSVLEKSDLKSSQEEGNRDGDILLRKIKAFLSEKKLPKEKMDLIIRTLQNTLTTDNINKSENGESQLKRVFSKIVDDLGIYYRIGLTTDFTGKLFNEMYNWLGFTQDRLNDVVLTPSYVASFLAKLARVNMDTYVWDFATGSAGLLVAAMNIMIDDAKAKLKSPEKLKQKLAHIKAEQLLGIEILPQIYMLAILNMILMGDGSSNILNKDSLTDFEGNYGFVRSQEKFPADAFILNPPYSASGNGMIFVEKALSMMNKGYAAIIVQNSTGSGKAVEYNRNILKHSTLLASIKMPTDLFVGKSSVQTNVYVFKIGEAHQKDDVVKFIDFSNDGYTRTARKKASVNLKDTDMAKERYNEVVNLVRYGKSKLSIFSEKEYYEGTINPNNGADWNQSAPIDINPTFEDFKKNVSDYLVWEISTILKNQTNVDNCLLKCPLNAELNSVRWGEFKVSELFEVQRIQKMLSKTDTTDYGDYPVYSSESSNNGIIGYTSNPEFICNEQHPIYITFGDHTRMFNIANKSFSVIDNVKVLLPTPICTSSIKSLLYITSVWKKQIPSLGYSRHWKIAKNCILRLPVKLDGKIDFSMIETFITAIQKLLTTGILRYVNENLEQQ